AAPRDRAGGGPGGAADGRARAHGGPAAEGLGRGGGGPRVARRRARAAAGARRAPVHARGVRRRPRAGRGRVAADDLGAGGGRRAVPLASSRPGTPELAGSGRLDERPAGGPARAGSFWTS